MIFSSDILWPEQLSKKVSGNDKTSLQSINLGQPVEPHNSGMYPYSLCFLNNFYTRGFKIGIYLLLTSISIILTLTCMSILLHTNSQVSRGEQYKSVGGVFTLTGSFKRGDVTTEDIFWRLGWVRTDVFDFLEYGLTGALSDKHSAGRFCLSTNLYLSL